MKYETCKFYNNNTRLGWCEKRSIQCLRNTSCVLCYELDECYEPDEPEEEKVLWGAIVTSTGLIIQEPIKCEYNLHGTLWQSNVTSLSIQEGIIISSDETRFGSFDKKDVENFILGVRAIQKALKDSLPLD